ncbi:hypothetical protein OWV82_008387 [Melia azedarach]|uniref:Uncharacterized protein n=1 Tax=Melia azedarach TaxID=155640 RepID=A0ACC1YA33_MELAZ|nr:hypothetical protein OWV82_008387 [Melia azedarach]
MGSKKLQGLLLVMFLMNLRVFAASSEPIIEKGLPSDSSKNIDLDDKDIQHENGTREAYGKAYNGGSIAHSQKTGRGIGYGGAHTAGSTGASQHGNNGDSGTPHTYVGGAASNHHPNTHHGAGSCNQNCIGLFTFILSGLATLVHLCIEWQN